MHKIQTEGKNKNGYNNTKTKSEELENIGKILQRDAAAAYTDADVSLYRHMFFTSLHISVDINLLCIMVFQQ